MMQMSQERRAKVYSAIHDPITDLRIALKFAPDVDAKVAQLEHEIWRKVKQALKLASE